MDHVVGRGEHLSKIAADYGFRTHLEIWDHAENSELKSKRKTPNILLPGDHLFVPDRELREETRATDARHSFTVKKERLTLKLQVKDLSNQPVANSPCALDVDGTTYNLTTDGEGRIEQEIPRNAQNGRLRMSLPDAPL